jgi:response regulator RpfG family c-di-GMP phosphodiesterase
MINPDRSVLTGGVPAETARILVVDDNHDMKVTMGAPTTVKSSRNRATVLCVDDEPEILAGISLHLRRKFEVITAVGGASGLEVLGSRRDISVVLSDMRMPGMDGATFLARVRQAAPDTVRMLLTGQTDLDSAIAAINEGQIFRFLTKPCPPERLVGAFEAASEQHALITAERVLLEQTLRGSIRMLTDVLSLANPQAFGRASRLKDRAVELASAAGLASLWQIEVAAMLSQIGCVSLPAATTEKLYFGRPLSSEEQSLADRLPAMATALLAHIPRLDEIRACLLNQSKHFDGSGQPANGLRGESLPAGSRVLKIVTDFDVLEARGDELAVSLATLRGREGEYDPRLLEVFTTLRGDNGHRHDVREIPLRMVQTGMTFVEDVTTAAGALLLPRGYEITEGLLERIRKFQVAGNVRVLVGSGRHE